jgi:hypothetical protein
MTWTLRSTLRIELWVDRKEVECRVPLSMSTLTLYSFSVDLKLNHQIQPKNASQKGLTTLKNSTLSRPPVSPMYKE